MSEFRKDVLMMMYSTPLSREMFTVPNFPLRKKSGVHISKENVKSFSEKKFLGKQAQTNLDVNTFSENNSLEFLFEEFSKEVCEAHLTAKVKNYFQKNKSSSLFIDNAHSLRFSNLIYLLGDVTTEKAVFAYLISLIDLSQYSKSFTLDNLSGNNLLLYKTAKAFKDTTRPPFTLSTLLALDDEIFKALLVAFCIMRKGKNLILNEVKKNYADISS